MKKVLMTTIAATVALSFAGAANAASPKHRVSADVRAACKQEAAKKFSAIHFIKRSHYANNCMAQHARTANAKTTSTVAKPTPTTTGQATKQ
jgi:hypothetical protein